VGVAVATTLSLGGTATAAASPTDQAADTSAGTSPAAATLITTNHHPFYDITRSAFVDAIDLHAGDQLQTPDGDAATITGVRAYHQTALTYDLTIDGLHTYYVEAGDTPVLVHNCNGPVRLSDDTIDTHILPRHGPGTPSAGTKFSESINPDGFEALANEAVSGSPIPSRIDPVTGNHAHDFDFGPAKVTGENGETGIRVWVDGRRNVTTMYPR
jgi:hypothetical protein